MNDFEHQAYHRRLAYTAIVIFLILIIGAFFYHRVEEWSYIDSLYFSTATLTTVGYGDLIPKTTEGKVFSIFYMFFGVGIVLFGISIIVTHFIEERELDWYKNRGRFSRFSKLKNIRNIRNLIRWKRQI